MFCINVLNAEKSAIWLLQVQLLCSSYLIWSYLLRATRLGCQESQPATSAPRVKYGQTSTRLSQTDRTKKIVSGTHQFWSVLVYGISRPQIIHVKNLILNLSNQSSSPGDIQTISNTLLIHHETFKMRTRCLHGSIARLFQLESFERWCAVYGFPNSQPFKAF